MTDADWGIDVPETNVQPSQTDAGRQEPELDALISPAAIRCANCMEVHAQCSENAAALVREQIKREIDNRLDRLEYVMSEMHEGDRVAVARWIQGVLDRPPLSNSRARSLDPIRAFLDAAWRDISALTPDPLVPDFEYGGDTWGVLRPHHEFEEMRPDEVIV